MNYLLKLLKQNIRQYGMVLALGAIMLFFAVYTSGISLTPLNITNLVLQNTYILILAIGMLLVILTGNIDLSVGSVAALVGAVAAILIRQYDVNWILATILSLALGASIGAWQGYWIAYKKIPAFIVTLAGMLLFRGLTLVVLKGQTLGPFPDTFNKISSGFTTDLFGSQGLHISTIVLGIIATVLFAVSVFKKRNKKINNNFKVNPLWIDIIYIVFIGAAINAFTITLGRYKGFPNIFILLFVLVFVYTFITNKVQFGRHVYALGGNEKAAKLSGINTEKVMMLVYVNMGLLAALSGLVYAARLNAATPKAGNLFELDAIASCYIGGASATGGVGTIIGAVIGGLVMGVINNGMSLAGLSIDWQQVVKGAVLLIAVWFDISTKRNSK